MFANLSEKLNATLRQISGKARITEENIKDTLRQVRMALIEADVALPVVREFVNQVKEKALGIEVNKSLTPGQEFLKIVQTELTTVMGGVNSELNLATNPPAVVLMAGLQGAGKTTSVAKLAKFLKEKKRKKVLLVSLDIYRPAAIEQLKTLAKSLEIECFSPNSNKPEEMAIEALNFAKLNFFDALLVDTAGRLHLDEMMMQELKAVHKILNPIETLFTVDAMTGQDAVNVAKEFAQTVPLTGVVLTKVDGDARGGAAMSVRYVTGVPIKFLGVGEKTDALEPFHPDRLASRILGMGDVLSLIEDLQKNVDLDKSQKMAEKFKKGDRFTLEDFKEQLLQMKKMGGLMSIMDKLPGLSNLPNGVKDQLDDKMFTKIEAIINSMTIKERNSPYIIKGSRKRRIALGSGTQVQDVNRLLKQFDEMQRMMNKMRQGGMGKMMRNMKNLIGGRFSGLGF